MILQLNPCLPVVIPRGKGYAVAVIDYGQEHHLYWVVVMDQDGEIWVTKNPDVRVQDNPTMDRPVVEVPRHNRDAAN